VLVQDVIQGINEKNSRFIMCATSVKPFCMVLCIVETGSNVIVTSGLDNVFLLIGHGFFLMADIQICYELLKMYIYIIHIKAILKSK
jgi:hypothetical protein